MMLSIARNRPAEAEQMITSSMEQIQEAIEENRKIAHEMVPPDFRKETLAEQVAALCRKMLELAGLEVRLALGSFDESRLTDQQKLTLYRIVQEQCTNIVRHAGAASVMLSLETAAESLQMHISDDGRGARPDKYADGIGLKNIRSRLSVHEGDAQILTAPGKGFSLRVSIPLGTRDARKDGGFQNTA